MAEDQGELSLTMRSMDDVGSEKDLPGRELSDLLEDERIEAIQEGRDRRNCVTVNAAGRGSSTKCTE